MGGTNQDGVPDGKIVHLADRIGLLADAAGVPRPDEAALLGVTLDVAAPIRTMAVRLAEVLRTRRTLFVRAGVPGTIEATGQWRTMTAERFTTWLGREGITTVKGQRDPRAEDLTLTGARQLLASDDLLAALPELRGVNVVRQPVLRDRLDERGLPVLELLPAGFDDETGVFTIDSVPVDETMYPEDGEQHLRALLKYFPWSDPARMSAQLLGMLTAFCREMYRGRAPMFVLNSNLPESGKSTLARLIMELVFGQIGSTRLNLKDEYGTEQKLHTIARNFKPVLWIDDMKGKIFSNDLNEWLTQPSRAGRILGGQEEFNVPVRTITLMTGAQLDLDDHLNRRAIWVDLFPRTPGNQRVLPTDAVRIDEDWFRDAGERSRVLSALWAAVRNWDGMNRPGPSRRVGSFEGWSGIVPGMVTALGWADPLTRFEAPDAGDSEGADMMNLVMELIRIYKIREGSVGYVTPEDIIGQARLMGLFADTLQTVDEIVADLDSKKGHAWKTKSADGVPTDGEKRRQAARWRDKAIDRAWGAKWRRRAMAGQEFVVDERRFQFGDRRSSKERRYEIREL
jgi:hypothetical protein